MLSVLLIYFLTCLLVTYLTTSSRIDPFCLQAKGHRSRPKLALVFLGGSFNVIVYSVTDTCLLFCLLQFFSTKPRDWLGRTSLK